MSVCWDPTGNCYFVGDYSGELDALGGALVEHVDALRAYTPIRAGTGRSTVLPGMDFETYSEAGYRWDPEANKGLGKWRSIVKSPPHGLGAVGAPVYSEHPSTEVLSLAYNFKDGVGARLWLPGMPPPSDLFEYMARGHVFEAWNSGFEFYIWQNVCTRMNWPELDVCQLRDAMAKARAFSLPAKLGKAAEILQVSDQKIDDGMRLIKKFSVPRNPTKKDDRRRLRMSDPDHAEDGQKFIDYNIGDIKAESAVSAEIPDLDPDELELWKVDQRINTRGVHIDREALSNCIAIVEQAFEKYQTDLVAITDGAVQSASELDKLIGWLAGRGVHMPNIQAETVETTLSEWRYPDTPDYNDARQVLQIRSILGAASIKKLFAIDRRTSADGRLRDLFAFCGADRTGRWAGRGPQPQNLPSQGPKVVQCDPINGCGKHYHARKDLDACPWCQTPSWAAQKADWSVEAVEDALQVIATRWLPHVEHYFGDPIAAVSGCLRGLFSAAPGSDLLCSDYSAIEAVVLAMLAGEDWRIEVFRTHGKIYEMSLAKITGIPFEEIMAHAGYTNLNSPRWWGAPQTGPHHPLRKKIGKVAELGCFAPDTRVLTARGYVRIVDVRKEDKLWDGVEWVASNGPVNKGRKKTIVVDGVRMTPEHPISIGRFWKATAELDLNENTLRQALAIGSENLPWSKTAGIEARMGRELFAPADSGRISSRIQICGRGNPRGAGTAVGKRAEKLTSKNTINTPLSCLTTKTGGVFVIELAQRSADATILAIKGLITTVAGAFLSAMNGDWIGVNFYATSKPSPDGTTRRSKWIESIRTGITRPGIFGLSRKPKTGGTNDRSSKCNGESTASKDVYDIVNAGPRNRFTIKTDSGHLIVHNSGYQGSVGAWKAFGADEYFETDEQIKEQVDAWRAASPNVVKFWYGLQDAAIAAVQNPGQNFQYRGIVYGVRDDVLYCQLLSGRKLAYHRPRLHPDVTPWGKTVQKLTYEGWNSDYKKGPQGWLRLDTYGGKLCENVVQATARDLLAYALKNIEAAGYPVVLHVHDEIVSEVPEGSGSIEEFERIMAAVPSWAHDWPVKAAGGWRGKRYRKD